jgi:hypothetical protein
MKKYHAEQHKAFILPVVLSVLFLLWQWVSLHSKDKLFRKKLGQKKLFRKKLGQKKLFRKKLGQKKLFRKKLGQKKLFRKKLGQKLNWYWKIT